MLKKIVSGGQTGVDRAALDAAIACGLEHGGWCPKGRRAEDGRIPQYYRLDETPRADYRQRTEWNVRDSDATLIIVRDVLKGGTLYTLKYAVHHRRPVFIAGLSCPVSLPALCSWIDGCGIAVLNVAGPREGPDPAIHRESKMLVEMLICSGRKRTPGDS